MAAVAGNGGRSMPGSPVLLERAPTPASTPLSSQPMDLSHYPFDSWDLAIQLELLSVPPPGHPGLTVEQSSAGLTLKS